MIDSPRPYSAVASGLLKALGIDPVALSKQSNRPEVYEKLGQGVFFDRATFGSDRLVAGLPDGDDPTAWAAFLAQTPLDATTRKAAEAEAARAAAEAAATDLRSRAAAAASSAAAAQARAVSAEVDAASERGEHVSRAGGDGIGAGRHRTSNLCAPLSPS
jgi:spermidine dehydrogenase